MSKKNVKFSMPKFVQPNKMVSSANAPKLEPASSVKIQAQEDGPKPISYDQGKCDGGGKDQTDIKFCFNAIVKNEATIMLRRLENIKHNIDAICITDTGSTDDTIKIIEEFGRNNNLPTKVDQSPFVNFAVSRNVALRNAEKFLSEIPGNWYLMMGDADDLNFGGNPIVTQKLPEKERPLFPEFDRETFDKDCYQVSMSSGGSVYIYTWMIRLRPGIVWEWKTPVHEYLRVKSNTTGKDAKYGILNGGYVESRREGSRTKDDDTKYYRDALVFERALKDPNEDRDRCTYYLAQSYRDCNMYEQAFINFEKRSLMGGHVGEVYVSLINMYRIKKEILKAVNQDLIGYLLKAIDVDPKRMEAPFELVKYYNTTNQNFYGLDKELDFMKNEYNRLITEIEKVKLNHNHLIERKDMFRGPRMNRLAWVFAQPFLECKITPEFLFAEVQVYDNLFFSEASWAAYYAGDLKKSKELTIRAVSSELIDPVRKANHQKDLESFFSKI